MRDIVKNYKYTDTYIDGELLIPISTLHSYFITKNLHFYSIRNSRTKILFRKLVPSVGSHGYYVLRVGGRTTPKHILIHRIIAETFIPNPDNKPFVNHIDGNKENYSIKNLEWVTGSENSIHSYKIGLSIIPQKEKLKNGKFYPLCKKVNQLSLEGIQIKTFDSIAEAERSLGFHSISISKCCRGKVKSAHGYKWTYEYN